MNKLEKENEGLFTVVIPSYNHEEFIIECLDSINNQDYPRIEVIMVDDCSKDKTLELAMSWRDSHKGCFERFIIAKNETNSGVVKTVNRGLEESRGEYIIRLASDDALLPNVIGTVIDEFKNHSDRYMISFNGYMDVDYPSTDTKLGSIQKMYDDAFFATRRPDFFTELYKVDFISAPGVIIRRDTYTELGVYDENSPIDDWEYYLRVALHNEPYFSDKCVVFFRQVPDSLSHSPSQKKRMMMNDGVMYVTDKYSEYVDAEIARKKKIERYNLILREALEWKDLTYARSVKARMRKSNIPFTTRCRIKCVLRGLL